MNDRRLLLSLLLALLFASALHATLAAEPGDRDDQSTLTPIKHLVVIFDENVSFDHYFATYPYALNPPAEPAFRARSDTPTVNGLTPALIANNPNAQPFR